MGVVTAESGLFAEGILDLRLQIGVTHRGHAAGRVVSCRSLGGAGARSSGYAAGGRVLSRRFRGPGWTHLSRRRRGLRLRGCASLGLRATSNLGGGSGRVDRGSLRLTALRGSRESQGKSEAKRRKCFIHWVFSCWEPFAVSATTVSTHKYVDLASKFRAIGGRQLITAVFPRCSMRWLCAPKQTRMVQAGKRRSRVRTQIEQAGTKVGT